MSRSFLDTVLSRAPWLAASIIVIASAAADDIVVPKAPAIPYGTSSGYVEVPPIETPRD